MSHAVVLWLWVPFIAERRPGGRLWRHIHPNTSEPLAQFRLHLCVQHAARQPSRLFTCLPYYRSSFSPGHLNRQSCSPSSCLMFSYPWRYINPVAGGANGGPWNTTIVGMIGVMCLDWVWHTVDGECCVFSELAYLVLFWIDRQLDGRRKKKTYVQLYFSL